MIISLKQILSILLVLLTIVSVNQWSSAPLGNTVFNWILYTLILITLIYSKKIYYNSLQNQKLKIIKIYILWVIICIIRGLFTAEYYWDYKHLINSGFALLLVFSIYAFTNPVVVQTTLKTWLKYALPLFIIVSLFLSSGSYGFYLIPVSLIALFLPAVSLRWRIIIVGISLIIIFIDLDARSNVIKFALPLILSIFFYFSRFLKTKLLKFIHVFFFILPFVFLFLGVTNTFNIFKMKEYIKGNYTETKIVNGESKEISLTADTRTFLYQEVILSALKHEYVLFGRTPARGNDSVAFGEETAKNLGTGRYERYSNEVSILNIFTWTGLIGVILYFLVFFKAASLALYQSNSSYLKILGLFVSFRWTYAWVEDANRFDIMNVILWITIAICYSQSFRGMNDQEIANWVRGIFSRKYRVGNNNSKYAQNIQ